MHGIEAIAEGNGLLLMIVGMSVVFTSLVVLMFVMKALKRYQETLHTLKLTRQRVKAEASELKVTSASGSEEVPGVVVAAIALTIIMEQSQVHDEESLVLTLQAFPKPYSNWWQSRIDAPWSPHMSPSNTKVLQAVDPERGKTV